MALHQCFSTWITHFWVQIVSSLTTNNQRPPSVEVIPSVEVLPSVEILPFFEVVPFLEVFPDNVIFDILSRLPAKSVSMFRLVCKKWLELTSTSDFTHIHLQRSNPSNNTILFLQCITKNSGYSYYEFFIFNRRAEKQKMFKNMRLNMNNSSPVLIGSSNGLLLFKSDSYDHWYYYLLNATTQECITIRCDMGILCGLFFHPSSKKYVLIMYSYKQAVVDGIYNYFLFSLEIECLRNVGTFPYHSTSCPIFCRGALHWLIDSKSSGTCENSLMVFNVETEVFSSFSHPGKQCLSTCNRDFMSLLEITGKLCFCRGIWDYIDMWVLEDYDKCIWVKNYVVPVLWNINPYPFESSNEFQAGEAAIRSLNFVNGELLIFWKQRGLFAYNLEKRKVRNFDLRVMKLYGKLHSVISATSHVKSLVSLKVRYFGEFPTRGLVIID